MSAMSPTAAVEEVLQRCRDWSPERYAAAQRALAELLAGEARYGFPTQPGTNVRSGLAGGLGTLVFGVMWMVFISFGRVSGQALLFMGAVGIITILVGGAMLWRSIAVMLAASSLSREASAQPLLSDLGEADALTQEVWGMYAGLRWPNMVVLAARLAGVKLILHRPGVPISPIFAAFNAVVIWPRGIDIKEAAFPVPGLTAPAHPVARPVAPQSAADWEVYQPGVVGSGGDDFSSAMAPSPPPPPAPPAPPAVAPPGPTMATPPPPRRAY
jgi:hypothetical protein